MAPFSKYTKGGMKEGTKIVTGFRDFLLRGNVVSTQQGHERYQGDLLPIHRLSNAQSSQHMLSRP